MEHGLTNYKRNKNYSPVTIRLFDRKKNVEYTETSLIAYDRESAEVIAVGKEALPLADMEDDRIVVQCPLKHGMIADYMAALAMFRGFFRKASLNRPLLKPKIAVCVPSDITDVERKACQDLFYQIGAKEVGLLVEKAETALRDLPPAFSILVEIGGDSCEGPDESKVWEEVCREKLPSDHYRITEAGRREAAVRVMLTGNSGRVEIIFERTAALRLIGGGLLPQSSELEAERRSFRDTHSPNRIYQSKEEQAGGAGAENKPGKAGAGFRKRYRILGETDLVEVWSDGEPSVAVIPLET